MIPMPPTRPSQGGLYGGVILLAVGLQDEYDGK